MSNKKLFLSTSLAMALSLGVSEASQLVSHDAAWAWHTGKQQAIAEVHGNILALYKKADSAKKSEINDAIKLANNGRNWEEVLELALHDDSNERKWIDGLSVTKQTTADQLIASITNSALGVLDLTNLSDVVDLSALTAEGAGDREVTISGALSGATLPSTIEIHDNVTKVIFASEDAANAFEFATITGGTAVELASTITTLTNQATTFGVLAKFDTITMHSAVVPASGSRSGFGSKNIILTGDVVELTKSGYFTDAASVKAAAGVETLQILDPGSAPSKMSEYLADPANTTLVNTLLVQQPDELSGPVPINLTETWPSAAGTVKAAANATAVMVTEAQVNSPSFAETLLTANSGAYDVQVIMVTDNSGGFTVPAPTTAGFTWIGKMLVLAAAPTSTTPLDLSAVTGSIDGLNIVLPTDPSSFTVTNDTLVGNIIKLPIGSKDDIVTIINSDDDNQALTLKSDGTSWSVQSGSSS